MKRNFSDFSQKPCPFSEDKKKIHNEFGIYFGKAPVETSDLAVIVKPPLLSYDAFTTSAVIGQQNLPVPPFIKTIAEVMLWVKVSNLSLKNAKQLLTDGFSFAKAPVTLDVNMVDSNFRFALHLGDIILIEVIGCSPKSAEDLTYVSLLRFLNLIISMLLMVICSCLGMNQRQQLVLFDMICSVVQRVLHNLF